MVLLPAISVPWVALGVVLLLWTAAWIAGFMLLAMGRISLDLNWGRSFHELGPTSYEIEAPREMIMEMLAAPYLGRTPGDSGIEVLAKDQQMVVAAHHTKVHFYTARTVEIVAFEPPGRVTFSHLHGPVPHAEEAFELSESAEGTTTLRYTGELGIDFSILGRIAASRWVVPQWEATVREHLDDVKERAEKKESQRAKREAPE